MKRLILLAVLSAFSYAQSLEFVHLTDTHVMQIEGIHPFLVPLRMPNALSAAQLEKYLDDRRVAPPSFFVHTGDIVEAFRYDSETGSPVNGQIERFQAILKHSPSPFYLALGNRDVSWYRYLDGKQVVVRDKAITTEARAAWAKSFECFRGGAWYSFEKRVGESAYLFAVLDNGDTADEALVQAQLAWLRKLLAGSKPAAVVVALHIPIGENSFGQSVREILAAYSAPVLILAGHRHTDGVEEISQSPRKVQVRTASFAGGKLSSRRIVLRTNAIDVYTTNEPEKLLLSVPTGSLQTDR